MSRKAHNKKVLDKKLRTIAFCLRQECPTSLGLPVRIRRCDKPNGYFGYTNLSMDETAFIIVLKTRIKDKITGKVRPMTYSELRDTLIHEWAHAMSWTVGEPSEGYHDAAWGVAYAKAYNAIIED